MDFVIKSKDKDGNVTFEGTANAVQASFLMNVGVNYLLQRGVEPMLVKDEGIGLVVEGTETRQ